MYRNALRNLLAHKGRLLMTALAIMLGTAFVAGSMVFSDTIDQAAKNSYSRSFDGLSVMVADMAASASDYRGQRSTAELNESTVAQIAALPGVAKTRAVVSDFTGVTDKQNKLIGPAWSDMAANFVPDASGTDPRYPMVQGRGPRAAGEIALDQQTARSGGYQIGDTVRIAVNGPAVPTVLTGIFTTKDPMVAGGGSLTLLDTATAQKMLLTPGQYSSIEVTAKPGTSDQALRDQVAKVVPDDSRRFIVGTADQMRAEQATMVAQRTNSLELILLTFAAISLFVGIFIIANTFTMLIAQRTKELALLRAIGAARAQVTKSVLAEAAVIGLLSAAAGLLAGIGVGAGLQSGLQSIARGMPTGALVVSPSTAITVLAVGVLVTMGSALLPAIRASRIAPVAAMSSGDQPTTQKSLLIRNSIGTLVTALGVGLILLGVMSDNSKQQYLRPGALFVTVGILILLPLLSRPAIAMAGPSMTRLFGTPGKLARLNAVRSPRRTAATAGAIAIGLSLVTAMTVIGSSVNDAVTRSVNDAVKADFAVVMTNGHGLSSQLPADIGKAPGVAAVSAVTSMNTTVDGSRRTIEGLDADSFEQLVKPSMTAGSADTLKQGQALVDTTFAQNNSLIAGSTINVSYPDGAAATLTVGGVFKDNQVLSPILLANSVIAKHNPQPLITQALVKGANGPSQALKQAIVTTTGDSPVIEVRDKHAMATDFSSTVKSAMNLLYVMLGMSVLVAALGVVNTMAMSVFERKREIGLLRALGLHRGGIRQMVRLESAVVSVFGAVVGMVLGSYLAWAEVNALVVELPNINTVLPFGELLLFLVIAGAVGIIAGLWPARQAARMDILDSINAS
ncbi:ABC transporter permease [Kitasatospora sp. RB6PN24]|uniref:ABC transporter permease n=1 Tax=Kitasatospora humi TaxID=2893891 RepID=UPI001E40676E|nr:ABC transporter permease [Kitasatospora humi]MCC9310598.1 ABC transporter permease [Kitasatospora humi]